MIRIGRENQCLPYAGFFILNILSQVIKITRPGTIPANIGHILML